MSMDVTERMEVDVMEVQNQAAYRSWHLAAKESPQAAQIFILLHLAEQWATNMEVGLSREPLEAIAEHVHREVTSGAGWLHLGTPWADAMVDFLGTCWAHGPALRRWYRAFTP
jgi:hypothetical protein